MREFLVDEDRCAGLGADTGKGEAGTRWQWGMLTLVALTISAADTHCPWPGPVLSANCIDLLIPATPGSVMGATSSYRGVD